MGHGLSDGLPVGLNHVIWAGVSERDRRYPLPITFDLDALYSENEKYLIN